MHVMVVENDPDIREIVAELLAADGHVVLTAAHGRDALAVLAGSEVKPSLIFLDLSMPVMDGWEFLDALDEVPGHAGIKVVMMSAHDVEDRRVAAVLRKPVTVDQLLAAARAAIGSGSP
jgi:CheY-like chemotaxis protein